MIFGFCVYPLLSESSLLPESVAIAGINIVCISLHLADIRQNFGEAQVNSELEKNKLERVHHSF